MKTRIFSQKDRLICFSINKSLLIISVAALFSTLLFSGCLDHEPPRVDEHLFSLTSEMVNSSIVDARDWIYQQADQPNTSCFIQATDAYGYLKDYEEMLFYWLFTDIAGTNDSFLKVHQDQLPLIQSIIPKKTNLSLVSFNDLIDLSIVHDILLLGPYSEQYQNETALIRSFLIKAYSNMTNPQSEEETVLYHLSMSHISQSLILHAYETENDTSYTYAIDILENANVPTDVSSETMLDLLCSSVYTESYRWVEVYFDEHRFDERLILISDHLLSYIETGENGLGSFPDITQNIETVPESLAESILTNVLAVTYDLALTNEIDTVIQEDIFISLILTNYRCLQEQITSKDPSVNGGFPLSNGSGQPNMLATIHRYSDLYSLSKLLDDKDPYIYIYNTETAELYESHPYDARATDSIWPALILGTILSIVFIGIIFVIIRYRKRK